ncbi:hypothetical protein EXIGLDRAFT_773358 [Exidia glandulosa HHB12029]|uniref:Pectate lyase superfamily protein domain-containing protein n=1 Tax=Exidia glandulosa HHB12029 TaxID=1314781 RepID=A0A165EUJ3_EXIGL|nr:hypothetical protein EXIGLDRAFT_773358 [Exidia glandulosa HHB12029]
MRLSLAFIAALCASTASAATAVDYTTIKTKKGDILPDFSYVGYRQGEHKLPSTQPHNASVVIAASKSSSDDQTKAIQDALDKVGAAGGGVVELAVGNHYVAGASIVIPSKTWIRGADAAKSIVIVKGDARAVFSIGTPDAKATTGAKAAITATYVPIGAASVAVDDASIFKVGQNVYVQRPATAEWIRANGMADLVRDGSPQTWIKAGTLIKQPRTITAISGNTITLDVPLTDSIEKKWGAGSVQAFTWPSQSQGAGIETMQIVLQPSCSGQPISDTSCQFQAIVFQPFALDSWASKINMTGFVTGFVKVFAGSRRITLENLNSIRDKVSDGSHGWGSDIAVEGTQILVQNCQSVGITDARSFAITTSSQTAGPNAILNHKSSLASQVIQPHQRWAHGLLVDNSQSGIDLSNRNNAGSGQGWAINGAVAWNSDAAFQIQSPPLGVNWGIGMRGKAGANSNGTLIATGETVTPKSLYTAQLQARRAATSS